MPDFFQKCQEVLLATWKSVSSHLVQDPTIDVIIKKELCQAISRCINSKTKSYRYVLPTQLIAKIVDSSLDCQCIQAGRGRQGDFDARSVCDEITVPFDRQHHNVLGGAPEPYVNNPLRVPEFSTAYRARQKDKKGWDDLIFVLQQVEKKRNAHFTEMVFEQTLIWIYRRLSIIQVTYPVPKRISLQRTEDLIGKYLSVSSGGERVLTIISALMEVIGERFGIFKEVYRRSITAADKQAGMVSDIECRDAKGNIVLAVEVKDRELIFNHIATKLPDIRAKRVSEILFIAQRGIHSKNHGKIDKLIESEFASGQNIYIFKNVLDFSSSILALVGEDGRRRFLESVGENLDTYKAAIQHRQDWANLLSQV